MMSASVLIPDPFSAVGGGKKDKKQKLDQYLGGQCGAQLHQASLPNMSGFLFLIGRQMAMLKAPSYIHFQIFYFLN